MIQGIAMNTLLQCQTKAQTCQAASYDRQRELTEPLNQERFHKRYCELSKARFQPRTAGHACPFRFSLIRLRSGTTHFGMSISPFVRGLGLLAGCLTIAGLGVACHSMHDPAGEKLQPTVAIRRAPLIQFRGAGSAAPEKPGECDCNNPAHWDGSTLYVFNSAGHPFRSAGRDVLNLKDDYRRCEYDNQAQGGRWIECTWKASDGYLYGWYHYEPRGVCPETPGVPARNLTAPKIGAATSTDNGATWHDLGIVLEAPPNTLNCETKNHYFAGGNGDFSVMLDAKQEYLYFIFSSYPNILAEQGVAMARMRWADRKQPRNKVWKWHAGRWDEPGIGGHVSTIFPVGTDWHRADADAIWGPSIHWNHYLHAYVVLLNRAKDGDWSQEGIYVSFTRELSNPSTWTKPQKIALSRDDLAWYPQVMGLDNSKLETDKLAGRVARLFIRGQSRWEITFLKPGESVGGLR